MNRELSRITWPLPGWVVAGPAIALGLISFVLVNNARDWAYIAMDRLSGMPSEALQITGPLSCICAAWIAERFTNRNSPLAVPILIRGAGQQGLRILGVLVGTWGCSHLLGSGIAILLLSQNATGGELYWAEILISLLRFTFFVSTGFLIGTVISKWHAPVWAILWSLFWVFLFPLYYPDIAIDSNSNLEYFLFPALAAATHRSLSNWVMAVVILWWVLVILFLVALNYSWFRHIAGISKGGWIKGISAGVLVIGGSFFLPTILPSPFVAGQPPRIVCEPSEYLEICVTEEQQIVLPEVTTRVNTVLERMGEYLPDEFSAIVSFFGLESALTNGYTEDELLVVNIGTTGMPTLEFDLATSIGGLSACHPQTSNPTAVGWTFALGQWLAPEGNYLESDDPQLQKLLNVDSDRVLKWYVANRKALRSCSYLGEGPA